MMVFAVVTHTIALIILITLIGNLIVDYRAAVGTVWQRSLAACRHSATILWARLVIVGGLVLDILSYVAEILGAPGVSSAIQQYLSPGVVAVLMIAVAFVSEIARRRTLNQ